MIIPVGGSYDPGFVDSSVTGNRGALLTSQEQ